MKPIEFEITQVQAKKTVSMDKEYKVVLRTEDPSVLEWAKYINERTVKLEVRE